MFLNKSNYNYGLQPEQDRVFDVMGKRFKLKKDTVNRLLYLNKSPTAKTNERIDKTYIDLLLISAFNINSLKQYKLDNDILNTIKGELLH